MSDKQLARLQAEADEAVWSGTLWLTAADVALRAPARASVSSGLLTQWEQEGRLFGLERGGQRWYPLYAFAADFTPVPPLRCVLKALDSWPPMAKACFFESTSAFLAGRRPRELLAAHADSVIAKIRNDLVSEKYCG